MVWQISFGGFVVVMCDCVIFDGVMCDGVDCFVSDAILTLDFVLF